MATMAQTIAKATAVYNPTVTQLDNGDIEITWPIIPGQVVSQCEAIASAAGIENDMIDVMTDDTLGLYIPAMVNSDDPAAERNTLTGDYVALHAELTGVLANLQEFVGSLPAPDEDGNAPASIDWAEIGSLSLLVKQLREASETTDGMF